jgi:hypothetical protein
LVLRSASGAIIFSVGFSATVLRAGEDFIWHPSPLCFQLALVAPIAVLLSVGLSMRRRQGYVSCRGAATRCLHNFSLWGAHNLIPGLIDCRGKCNLVMAGNYTDSGSSNLISGQGR